MPQDDGYGIDEIGQYNFGAAPMADGYDPNAVSWKKPPVGEFEFEIVGEDSKLVMNKSLKWDGSTYTLNEWQPRLRLVGAAPGGTALDPKYVGATITDYIPTPTPGQVMAGGQANKWANHIKAFGFPPPVGQYAPTGFSFKSLAGKRALVTIAMRTQKNQGTGKHEPVMDTDGTPKVEVKFFGYRMLPATEAELRAKGWTPGTAATAPTSAQPVGTQAVGQPVGAAAEDIDL